MILESFKVYTSEFGLSCHLKSIQVSLAYHATRYLAAKPPTNILSHAQNLNVSDRGDMLEILHRLEMRSVYSVLCANLI